MLADHPGHLRVEQPFVPRQRTKSERLFTFRQMIFSTKDCVALIRCLLQALARPTQLSARRLSAGKAIWGLYDSGTE